ncbi:MAG: indolepyruvate ferredoxin oxidoreductase family protein [Acidimicrobiia bacterium]|nr:indolepyruvate ferredoxin oxidoreductase family protein [Acidimicrobiia bacterium]
MASVKLTDKYTQQSGNVYLTGIQALVRLPLEQMRLDRAAGLRTGAFISGYEGSPLGGYDMALQGSMGLLEEHGIHFQPAVNEDLAATSVFGSQIFQVLGQGKVDGVVGIWYGKGPGVDRSGDVLRHANLSGSPGLCAALVLAGDDHACKSSSIPHQSDFSLYNAGIPILFPGNTQEILDYGLYAIALSRFSGAWSSLKLLTHICDGGGTVAVGPERHRFRNPEAYEKKTDARLTPPLTNALEAETHWRRIRAVREFARANPINRWHGAREQAWLGLATAGKYYYDLMQALSDLGIGQEELRRLGIRLAKFGMTFPLEQGFCEEFAEGLETVLVVEEKRSFLELQLREALYNLAARPRILGKQDEEGAPLLPASYEMDPDGIARNIAKYLTRRQGLESVERRLRLVEEIAARPREKFFVRTPSYCPGCPHNRSTLLLEGQAAGGGIGCHGMGILMKDAGRGYEFATHMGGEGAPWIGMSPFLERRHIFQNMGDGTYFHSGALAIEAAIAAGVNITYKILYNGAVAMTGGQDAVGALPVAQLTRKLEAEGVRKIVIVAERPEQYNDPGELARNATVRSREELPEVLRELEETAGVSVLIYDQECAAEKRRKRSRGIYAEPTMRLVIHEEVCEGCGDCVTQSNCMSLQPVTTALGEKMRIHQSSCNKDYTCALGDCPSFVSVQIKPGTGLRRRQLPELPMADVPEPAYRMEAGSGYRILSPGIGGTGVLTMNALLAAAATMDGLFVSTLDQTGLAQKGGAVVSHLTLSREPWEAAARINTGNADLILGFDLLGVTHADNLRCAHANRTAAVVNTDLIPTAGSIRHRVVMSGGEQKLEEIEACTKASANLYVDASRLAERLFGSHMFVNMFLLGAAWQAGLVPVSRASLERAIQLNGVAVERNLQAFLWGRKYAEDGEWVEKQAGADRVEKKAAAGFDLEAYQNAAYAREHAKFVEQVRVRQPELAETVSWNLAKLMAYKDEYEVARLLSGEELEGQVKEMWEAPVGLSYNLHPPLLRTLGLKRKLKLGGWFRLPLRVLSGMKWLRGTPLDVFGWHPHRRRERELISWYRQLVEQVLAAANEENLEQARQILALPEQIRGYDRIKDGAIARVKAQAASMVAQLNEAPQPARIL